jgi:hypothetical protein
MQRQRVLSAVLAVLAVLAVPAVPVVLGMQGMGVMGVMGVQGVQRVYHAASSVRPRRGYPPMSEATHPLYPLNPHPQPMPEAYLYGRPPTCAPCRYGWPPTCAPCRYGWQPFCAPCRYDRPPTCAPCRCGWPPTCAPCRYGRPASQARLPPSQASPASTQRGQRVCSATMPARSATKAPRPRR